MKRQSSSTENETFGTLDDSFRDDIVGPSKGSITASSLPDTNVITPSSIDKFRAERLLHSNLAELDDSRESLDVVRPPRSPPSCDIFSFQDLDLNGDIPTCNEDNDATISEFEEGNSHNNSSKTPAGPPGALLPSSTHRSIQDHCSQSKNTDDCPECVCDINCTALFKPRYSNTHRSYEPLRRYKVSVQFDSSTGQHVSSHRSVSSHISLKVAEYHCQLKDGYNVNFSVSRGSFPLRNGRPFATQSIDTRNSHSAFSASGTNIANSHMLLVASPLFNVGARVMMIENTSFLEFYHVITKELFIRRELESIPISISFTESYFSRNYCVQHDESGLPNFPLDLLLQFDTSYSIYNFTFRKNSSSRVTESCFTLRDISSDYRRNQQSLRAAYRNSKNVILFLFRNIETPNVYTIQCVDNYDSLTLYSITIDNMDLLELSSCFVNDETLSLVLLHPPSNENILISIVNILSEKVSISSATFTRFPHFMNLNSTSMMFYVRYYSNSVSESKEIVLLGAKYSNYKNSAILCMQFLNYDNSLPSFGSYLRFTNEGSHDIIQSNLSLSKLLENFVFHVSPKCHPYLLFFNANQQCAIFPILQRISSKKIIFPGTVIRSTDLDKPGNFYFSKEQVSKLNAYFNPISRLFHIKLDDQFYEVADTLMLQLFRKAFKRKPFIFPDDDMDLIDDIVHEYVNLHCFHTVEASSNFWSCLLRYILCRSKFVAPPRLSNVADSTNKKPSDTLNSACNVDDSAEEDKNFSK